MGANHPPTVQAQWASNREAWRVMCPRCYSPHLHPAVPGMAVGRCGARYIVECPATSRPDLHPQESAGLHGGRDE